MWYHFHEGPLIVTEIPAATWFLGIPKRQLNLEHRCSLGNLAFTGQDQSHCIHFHIKDIQKQQSCAHKKSCISRTKDSKGGRKKGNESNILCLHLIFPTSWALEKKLEIKRMCHSHFPALHTCKQLYLKLTIPLSFLCSGNFRNVLDPANKFLLIATISFFLKLNAQAKPDLQFPYTPFISPPGICVFLIL